MIHIAFYIVIGIVIGYMAHAWLGTEAADVEADVKTVETDVKSKL